jgi:hypothetical protein|tara:strand:- start:349 stop:462 length:114 start_codon:yes stop_codon:yes gene_type:complete
MFGIGHGGAGDLHTKFNSGLHLFELMKHSISPQGEQW